MQLLLLRQHERQMSQSAHASVNADIVGSSAHHQLRLLPIRHHFWSGCTQVSAGYALFLPTLGVSDICFRCKVETPCVIRQLA